MILHVVGGEGEFEPQPEMREADHHPFFLDRIRDTAASGVHRFHERSNTKALLEQIARGEIGFETGSQELSRQFSQNHVGGSRDGAFFMFELGCADPATRLYSLVKYDYRQAIELYDNAGRNALRQIVQAFVHERRAIQKSCLIRVRDGAAEGIVSARDRMGQAPDLTDYFQRFLDVARDRTDVELSKALNEAIRATLQECKAVLPPPGLLSAVGRAKDALRARERVDEEAVREAIFVAAGQPENEDTRSLLERSVNRQLRGKRLVGVSFRPDPQVFRRAPRRLIRTAEGVVVEFPGEQEGHTVIKNVVDGITRITITTTQELVADETVAERTRANA